MKSLVWVTLISMVRDRLLHGILVSSFLFLCIPVISSLSMRQVTELSVTLSLSLISFILLLLAVFFGGTTIWKDMERRYTFSVLSLPLSRSTYLIGRFLGVAVILIGTLTLLGCVALVVIKITSLTVPPERPLQWSLLIMAIFFDGLKYLLLTAVAFLFSSVSTSFFLPVFGTIAVYLGGSVMQQVYDYAHSTAGKDLSPLVNTAVSCIYWIVPNLGAFDLKLNAIYGIALDQRGILLTGLYFVLYTGLVLTGACIMFNRQELK